MTSCLQIIGSERPHRCFQFILLIGPQLRMKPGGAALGITKVNQTHWLRLHAQNILGFALQAQYRRYSHWAVNMDKENECLLWLTSSTGCSYAVFVCMIPTRSNEEVRASSSCITTKKSESSCKKAGWGGWVNEHRTLPQEAGVCVPWKTKWTLSYFQTPCFFSLKLNLCKLTLSM